PTVSGTIKLQSARLEVDRILAAFYNPYSVMSLPNVPSAERTAEATGSAEAATTQALQQAQTLAAPPGATQPTPGAPPPGGVFGPLELNVHVRIPENLVLRGRNLRPGGPTGLALGNINITVGGDLDLRKPADDQLIVLGRIDTVRGTYEFQGRRFN